MMLVPLTSGDADPAIATVVGNGGRLLGRGTIPGSLIVEGARADLFGPLMRRGVLVVAAIGGCRTVETTR